MADKTIFLAVRLKMGFEIELVVWRRLIEKCVTFIILPLIKFDVHVHVHDI